MQKHTYTQKALGSRDDNSTSDLACYDEHIGRFGIFPTYCVSGRRTTIQPTTHPTTHHHPRTHPNHKHTHTPFKSRFMYCCVFLWWTARCKKQSRQTATPDCLPRISTALSALSDINEPFSKQIRNKYNYS
jgi:hypothetical protein